MQIIHMTYKFAKYEQWKFNSAPVVTFAMLRRRINYHTIIFAIIKRPYQRLRWRLNVWQIKRSDHH